MSRAKSVEINYRLATSVVRFTGTVTTTTPIHRGSPSHVVDAKATLTTVADQDRTPLKFTTTDHTIAQAKITFALTDDGRLSSSDVGVTGSGAQVVGAVTSIVGAAISVAVHTHAHHSLVVSDALLAAPHSEPHEQTSNEVLARADFSGDDLLAKVIARQDALTGLLADATTDTTASTVELWARQLKLLTAQRSRLAAEKAAWESPGTPLIESFDISIPVTSLPTADDLLQGQLAGDALELWDALGIAATVAPEDPKHPHLRHPHDATADEGNDEGVIFFRRPRPERLTIWKKPAGGGVPDIVEITDVHLVDKHCTIDSIPLGPGGFFGSSDIDVAFAENGTPTKIAVSETSALSAVLSALPGAAKSFQDGLATYTDAQKALQPPAAQDPVAKQITALEQQKQLLQLNAAITKLTRPGA